MCWFAGDNVGMVREARDRATDPTGEPLPGTQGELY